ncbi:MAG TPA: PEGA domain-containing protein, partial [Nannocystaceae bacterium]|nr:PEGA domain-containing protein [Nannocystaceae bacterium]
MGTSSWIMVAALRAFVHTDAHEEPTESQPSETADVEAPPSDAGGDIVLEPVRFGDAGDERVAKAFDAALREQLSPAPACTAEPCADDATPRIRVDVRERERDYAMTISIVDAQGNVAKTRDVDCTVCTPTEAATAAAAATRELMSAPSDVARLHVDSRPSGAEVWLDGLKVGTTPVDLTTAPGAHTV